MSSCQKNHPHTRSRSTRQNHVKWVGAEDPDGVQARFINDYIGWGVFASKEFNKGDFILEYKGDWITKEMADERYETYNRRHSYQFFVKWHGSTMCVDATNNTSLGRLVNDSAPRDPMCNSRMRKVIINQRPHLYLVATKVIRVDDELRYSYDDDDKGSNLPWRITSPKKACTIQGSAQTTCLTQHHPDEVANQETVTINGIPETTCQKQCHLDEVDVQETGIIQGIPETTCQKQCLPDEVEVNETHSTINDSAVTAYQTLHHPDGGAVKDAHTIQDCAETTCQTQHHPDEVAIQENVTINGPAEITFQKQCHSEEVDVQYPVTIQVSAETTCQTQHHPDEVALQETVTINGPAEITFQKQCHSDEVDVQDPVTIQGSAETCQTQHHPDEVAIQETVTINGIPETTCQKQFLPDEVEVNETDSTINDSAVTAYQTLHHPDGGAVKDTHTIQYCAKTTCQTQHHPDEVALQENVTINGPAEITFQKQCHSDEVDVQDPVTIQGSAETTCQTQHHPNEVALQETVTINGHAEITFQKQCYSDEVDVQDPVTIQGSAETCQTQHHPGEVAIQETVTINGPAETNFQKQCHSDEVDVQDPVTIQGSAETTCQTQHHPDEFAVQQAVTIDDRAEIAFQRQCQSDEANVLVTVNHPDEVAIHETVTNKYVIESVPGKGTAGMPGGDEVVCIDVSSVDAVYCVPESEFNEDSVSALDSSDVQDIGTSTGFAEIPCQKPSECDAEQCDEDDSSWADDSAGEDDPDYVCETDPDYVCETDGGESDSSGEKNTCKEKTSSDNSPISVMQTNNKNGKRTYDKVSYCPFCEKPQKKFPRHLAETKAHQNIPKIIQWKSTTDARTKDKLLAEMRNLGNYKHNVKVLKAQEGVIIPVYRPTTNKHPNQYLPCPHCLGFFSKDELWKHNCKAEEMAAEESDEDKESGKQKRKESRVKRGKCLVPHPEEINTASRRILAGLREGEIARIIRSDKLIRKLADDFSETHGHDREQDDHIRNKLRELARLLKQYRELTSDKNASLTDMIHPGKFKDVAEAVKVTAGFQEDTQLYATPSLALKLGYTLKNAAESILGDALMDDEPLLRGRSKEFLELYRLRWKRLVSSHALRTLREKRRNNPKLLPLTRDVVLFTKFLEEKSKLAVTNLKECKQTDQIAGAWRELSEVTLAQVLNFNKKRQGEPSKMTTADFSKCRRGRQDFVREGLSKWEQQLCDNMWRVEVVGKKGNTVPILLTESMKTNMNTIQVFRDRAGILDDNPYMFPTFEAMSHLRGSDVLRELAKESGAECPKNITSTSLRKHIGVVSQIMNLQNNELDVLAKFLGHDIRTHREYYRLPEECLQVAKVSKILLKMGDGDIHAMAGKTLDEIELDENEDVEPEELAGEEEEGLDLQESQESQEARKPPRDVEPEELAGEEEEGLDLQESQEARKPPRDRRQVKKRPWTKQEKAAVRKHLGNYLSEHRLPGKQAIMACIRAEPELERRGWQKVKDFVRNRIIKPCPMDF